MTIRVFYTTTRVDDAQRCEWYWWWCLTASDGTSLMLDMYSIYMDVIYICSDIYGGRKKPNECDQHIEMRACNKNQHSRPHASSRHIVLLVEEANTISVHTVSSYEYMPSSKRNISEQRTQYACTSISQPKTNRRRRPRESSSV